MLKELILKFLPQNKSQVTARLPDLASYAKLLVIKYYVYKLLVLYHVDIYRGKLILSSLH